MSDALPAGHARRVLEGDPKTIVEARALFENDRENGLLPYAVALYSLQRRHPRFATELIALRDRLVASTIALSHIYADEGTAVQLAVRADCFATYLYWISTRKEVRLANADEAYRVAEKGCRWGLDVTQIYKRLFVGHEAPALLGLTLVELLMDKRRLLPLNEKEIMKRLRSVREKMRFVIPSEQRARAYRKYGLLAARRTFVHGLGWTLRSCFVQGIVPMTRLKNLGAVALVFRALV